MIPNNVITALRRLFYMTIVCFRAAPHTQTDQAHTNLMPPHVSFYFGCISLTHSAVMTGVLAGRDRLVSGIYERKIALTVCIFSVPKFAWSL